MSTLLWRLDQRARDTVLLINVVILFLLKLSPFCQLQLRTGVSNTRPAKGVSAARDSLLNRQNQKFLSLKDRKCSNIVKLYTKYDIFFHIAAHKGLFYSKIRPALNFFLPMWPSIDLSLRPRVARSQKVKKAKFGHKQFQKRPNSQIVKKAK